MFIGLFPVCFSLAFCFGVVRYPKLNPLLLTACKIIVSYRIKDEEKTELIYRVPCENYASSYVGETGRKCGLSIKEHKKEVDSFTAGTQTRASRAKESSVTHKSAITDHAVEENHVIDWNKATVVDREAQ